MPYPYDQVFAADPATPENVASNGVVTIFAPGDPDRTPLTITTLDGLPLPNPMQVNDAGFGPAFMHATLDQVAWSGAGFTGLFVSYKGMKDEAVAARVAAETAAAIAPTPILEGMVADARAAAKAAEGTAARITARADAGEFIGPAGPNTVPTQEAVADYISTPGNPTNGALERLYRTAVTPSEFGAVGDGVADDYAALQAGLDSALARKLAFQFDGRTYAVSKTLLYGSQEVGGVFTSTRIRQTTPGRPVMASASWGGRPGPHGRAYVHDLILEGESADPNSHGLVMRDYYSKLERIRVANAGGHGIYVTPFNSAGEGTTGTLVDNVFKDLQARNCKGWGILLGEAHNNKLTDGYASELFVSCAPNAMGGILIGSAAGWKLNALHTYGGSCPVAVSIFNGYWTDINGLYLEDNWTSTGLLFSSVQQGVTVDHITVKIPAAAISPTALKVESRSLAYQDAAVNIGSLMVRHSGTGPATAIGLESDTTSVAVDNLSVLGAGKGRVTKYGGFEGGRIRRISDAIIESPIRDTPARVSLAVNGIPLGLAMTARWVGSGPQTVVLPLPELQTYQVVHATLSLGSAGNYNGGVRARWRSDLVVVSKAASDPWSVYPADILPPTGLTGTPLIAVDRAAKQMTVTFTPSAADGYGYVSLTMEYA